MLRGKDIVCVSSLDWGTMWTSKQQIMHRLAQTNRVLYVEEPVTMLAPLKVPARWRRWAAVPPRLKRVDAGLWTLTPPPLLPFGNMRAGVNRANQAVLARYIRWAMDRLYFDEEYIFWTYLPTSLALLDRLGASSSGARPAAPGRTAVPEEPPAASGGVSQTPAPSVGALAASVAGRHASLVVYHCVDEHSAFPGFVSPDVVKGYDDELTRRADLVVATSENLRRSREALNSHTYTVLNAADVEIFNRALDPALPLPEDLSTIPVPRLGVVGLHDSRLDVDALEALAGADPAWQIVLIGPVKSGQVDEARLRRWPNIHLLGEKPRPALPAYLKGMAVALIPYRANELTRNIFPLKLFEYLAAGVPVVVGGLPELARFAGTIGVAGGPGDYPGLVRAALAEDGPEKRAARVTLAAENTWDHRVEEISRLVEEALVRSGRTVET
jgi:glycosyltransferase involved in cell wall biosynthesis